MWKMTFLNNKLNELEMLPCSQEGHTMGKMSTRAEHVGFFPSSTYEIASGVMSLPLGFPSQDTYLHAVGSTAGGQQDRGRDA